MYISYNNCNQPYEHTIKLVTLINGTKLVTLISGTRPCACVCVCVSTRLVYLLNSTRAVDELVKIMFVHLEVSHNEREERNSLSCARGHLKHTVTLEEVIDTHATTLFSSRPCPGATKQPQPGDRYIKVSLTLASRVLFNSSM